MPDAKHGPLKLQVVLGSTRQGRAGAAVAEWVKEIASRREDIEVELVDVAAFKLPVYDEAVPPSIGMPYQHEHTKRWSDKIAQADAYVFVSPEYNHGVAGSMKNAVDFLYKEWNNKAVGFVSYGSNGGSRAVEQWRQIVAELQMADVREQVLLSLATDFINYSEFKPAEGKEVFVNKMLDQLVSWGRAMMLVRES